jgi:hypothetical protein
MARAIRSPAVLMTAYVLLGVCNGPWVKLDNGPAHRSLIGIAVVALLAVCAAQGARFARVLLMALSAIGLVIALFGTAHGPMPVYARPCYLLIVLTQIALLVSTPMYERTRPGWAPGQAPSGPFLPLPPWWALLAGAGMGLVITLLPLSGVSGVSCPPGRAAGMQCLANGFGAPTEYRFFSGIFTMHAGNLQWLLVPAPRGVLLAAFAADWVMWSLAVLTVLYLFWLMVRRELTGPRPATAGQPAVT